MKKISIAIFASGTGSNADNIIKWQKLHEADCPFKVSLVVCNKPGAGVLEVAANHKVPTLLIEKEQFFRGDGYVAELKAHEVDFIVLAGFLWKIPSSLVDAYRHHIINIHPALLPKYGGKGMYGAKVHEAVLAAGDIESGITIHWVDEQYDHGSIIFQARCAIVPGDTTESLAGKIHQLEYEHFPRVIAEITSEIIAASNS